MTHAAAHESHLSMEMYNRQVLCAFEVWVGLHALATSNGDQSPHRPRPTLTGSRFCSSYQLHKVFSPSQGNASSRPRARTRTREPKYISAPRPHSESEIPALKTSSLGSCFLRKNLQIDSHAMRAVLNRSWQMTQFMNSGEAACYRALWSERVE